MHRLTWGCLSWELCVFIRMKVEVDATVISVNHEHFRYVISVGDVRFYPNNMNTSDKSSAWVMCSSTLTIRTLTVGPLH